MMDIEVTALDARRAMRSASRSRSIVGTQAGPAGGLAQRPEKVKT
jgi:hypothetical protein